MAPSGKKKKFVTVKQHSAEHGQTMLANDRFAGRLFGRSGRSPQHQQKHLFHLCWRICVTSFLYSACYHIRTVQHELAIEEVQGLQRGRGLTSLRHWLAGIGAVEDTEDRHRFHADFVSVNHPPQFVRLEFLDGRKAAQTATSFEEVIA